MKRRSFIKAISAAIAAIPFIGSVRGSEYDEDLHWSSEEMKAIMRNPRRPANYNMIGRNVSDKISAMWKPMDAETMKLIAEKGIQWRYHGFQIVEDRRRTV